MEIIKIDLDSHDDLPVFFERTWIIKSLGLEIKRVKCYKTKHGYHVYIHVTNKLNPMKVLLIQSMLGDEYRHVLGALRRLDEGAENWNALFQRKTGLDQIGEKIIISEEDLDQETSTKLESLLINGIENLDEKDF